ncbi:thioredoxin family protein [Geobacillus stearothermophilus]|uniref:thioredoxin family protein n=1 Tax=Geobacillus stearothermophilus TaxID=1422 RepID=UPI0006559ABB|nr:thioredoxin family protein [Geobacillus stearothermophilus]AKM20272.1 Thioredoxin [Geobacillus sp. 12AMOR1]MED4924256.1 thioredoxin family protein [Anoxybacillus geothermalis]STO13560.1 thioredoxin [[Flavobacterium] thermophilum]MDF9297726.1 thioredoxin family protein [Geobacillus stearothermophilus]MED4301105.1 thioredoxin family protein [Geobacillus stearothermophilus]
MNTIGRNDIKRMVEGEPLLALSLYTPLCGTCQLARRMLVVVEQLFPDIPFCETDINYIPEQAAAWKIESVPCLLLFAGGEIIGKWYAFHSVPYLYEAIRARLPR